MIPGLQRFVFLLIELKNKQSQFLKKGNILQDLSKVNAVVKINKFFATEFPSRARHLFSLPLFFLNFFSKFDPLGHF